jgi:hypothetical protein
MCIGKKTHAVKTSDSSSLAPQTQDGRGLTKKLLEKTIFIEYLFNQKFSEYL